MFQSNQQAGGQDNYRGSERSSRNPTLFPQLSQISEDENALEGVGAVNSFLIRRPRRASLLQNAAAVSAVSSVFLEEKTVCVDEYMNTSTPGVVAGDDFSMFCFHLMSENAIYPYFEAK